MAEDKTARPPTLPPTPRNATALLDLMREHADYMASYSEPFVGSTEAIARYLRNGADYIDQLERELAAERERVNDWKETCSKMSLAAARLSIATPRDQQWIEDAHSAAKSAGEYLRKLMEDGKDHGPGFDQAHTLLHALRNTLTLLAAAPLSHVAATSQSEEHALAKLKEALGGCENADATITMHNAATRINRLQDTLDGKYTPPSAIEPRTTEVTNAMLYAAQDACEQTPFIRNVTPMDMKRIIKAALEAM